MQILLADLDTNIISQHYFNGKTSLIIAAEYEQVKVFKLLVEHCKDIFKNNVERLKEFINFEDNDYYTALDYAVDYWGRSGDTEMIEILLELQDKKDKCLVNQEKIHMLNTISDGFGNTLLIDAIYFHKIKIVERLLEFSGTDVDKEFTFTSPVHGSRNGGQAFLLAVREGNIEIVQAFLKHPPIDITQVNQDQESALIIAVRYSNVEAFILLVHHLFTHWQAIFENDIEKLREYINLQDKRGYTVLYYTLDNYLQSDEGNIEIMETAIKSDNKAENFNDAAAYNNKSVIPFKLSLAALKEAIKNYNISTELKPDFIYTPNDKGTITLFDLDKYENGIQEVVTAGEHQVEYAY